MGAKENLLPWHITKSELLLDRSPWMRIFSDDVQLPDGSIVEGYLRLESRGYVMVVPIDDENRIGLVRSYKKGVDGIDIQPPAGVLEPGEDVLTSAKRELREELGCEATSWHSLGAYTISGNYGAGEVHFYLAVGAHQVVEPDSGDLEEQEVVWFPMEKVHEMWVSGKMKQLGSMAALGLAFSRIASNDTMPERGEG
jgi:8-oxo-dGTP pyrophosphatase MutT (NUDIX family)